MAACYLAVYRYKARRNIILGKFNNELVMGIYMGAGERFEYA